MACGGCAKRAELAARRKADAEKDLMGGYKYLNNIQIKARLEAYKRKYCTKCDKRFDCDYASYVKCKNIKNK